MKKILIIGGTGTISSPITEMLAEKNYDVTVLNRGKNNVGLPGNVKKLPGDITETEKMRELFKDAAYDSVINFIVWNEQDAKNNVAIFKGKTKQFIYISTVCVLNHEYTCLIDEETEKGNYYSDYGAAKSAAEDVFLQAEKNDNFPITIVRPTQTYSNHRIPLSVKGKGCWSVVSRMLRNKEVIIHGDGQSVWASTHASDFAKGFCPIVGNEQTLGETYQVMNPESHTWDMVYQTLAKLLNVDYRPVYIGTDLLKASKTYDFMGSIQGDKRWSNIFSIEKLKGINPDFTCEVGLEEGLRRYIEYMEAHPEMKVEEPEFDAWCDQTIERYKKFTQEFTADL